MFQICVNDFLHERAHRPPCGLGRMKHHGYPAVLQVNTAARPDARIEGRNEFSIFGGQTSYLINVNDKDFERGRKSFWVEGSNVFDVCQSADSSTEVLHVAKERLPVPRRRSLL